MGRTRTRADLVGAVVASTELPRSEANQLVEGVLESVAQALEDGETVKVSAFGTFQTRAKRERIGRNPKTGVEVPITPRRVVTFRPSHILKDRINATEDATESTNDA